MSIARPEIDVDKIVQMIRQEVRRQAATIATGRSRPLLESPPSRIPADLIRRLQGLTLTLETCASKLGTPTSEVQTLRGRVSLRLMRFIGRALWWYSYNLQNFASSIVHLQREQNKFLEAFARSEQLLQNAVSANEQALTDASAAIVRLDRELRAAEKAQEILRQDLERALAARQAGKPH
jgi:hypothetical protein